ncbi:hypothetical protein FLACOL_00170 [Flavobacterium columnare]|uniref:Uncharacterized protein n=2 Tax=Flavobacterium TaxID=237 RepID=A0A2N9P774_9FLAO|nr:hypothetical protein [Flavobacterium columnare]RVU91505.1 hypothetical protein EH230_11660 [Flavobacterium columnare]SPE76192.1 hypothetical protein FLACOL_00170 [Flavobacterium columnare]
MMIFFENPNLLISEFNEMASIAQKKAFITVGIEIQKEEIETIQNYIQNLNSLKKEYANKNFENEANLVYCIENSLLAIANELQMLVYIKEDKMNEAWNSLVKAQVIYGTVISNSTFQDESNEKYLTKLAQYEKLLFPHLFFQSVGGIIKKSHCSICKEKSGKCNHIKGKLYNGELCTRIITEMELEEISLVKNPANKHCRIISIEQNGKNIDILTLREIKLKK